MAKEHVESIPPSGGETPEDSTDQLTTIESNGKYRDGIVAIACAIGGLVVAFASLGLSWFVYTETRPAAQLERAQDQHMETVADELLLLLFQVAIAREDEQTVSDIGDEPSEEDDQLLAARNAAIQLSIRQLREGLRQGMALGLLYDMAGEHQWARRDFSNLMVTLTRLTRLDAGTAQSNDWTREDVQCVLARLADQFLRYREPLFERANAAPEVRDYVETVRNELQCSIRGSRMRGH